MCRRESIIVCGDLRFGGVQMMVMRDHALNCPNCMKKEGKGLVEMSQPVPDFRQTKRQAWFQHIRDLTGLGFYEAPAPLSWFKFAIRLRASIRTVRTAETNPRDPTVAVYLQLFTKQGRKTHLC